MNPKIARPPIVTRLPREGHLVVEANAGTGKTWLLERLVLDLLLLGEATIDEILVVTFTEKATSELRSRVRTLIEDALDGALRPPLPGEPHWSIDALARTRLERALFAFDAAPISTIHGFAQRVLSEYAFAHGALFKQERAEAEELFSDAFSETLRRELAVDPSCLPVLREYLADNSISALEELLFDAHEKRFSPTPLVPTLRALLKPLAPRTPQAAQTYAEQALAMLRDDEEHASLVRIAAINFKQKPPREPHSLPFVEALQIARDLACGRVSIEARAISAFLPRVRARLDANKRAAGTFDFDDLLRRLDEALKGSAGESLAANLRRRFRVALIDEFQDTDQLQWEIFRTLFVDGRSGHRLIVIGDPKQAIYGFRGADVHTYLEAKSALLAAGATLVALDVNHRSSAAMIDAYNAILDPSAPRPLLDGDVRYELPARACATAPRLFDAQKQEAPAIVMLDARQLAKPGDPLATAIAEELKRLLDDRTALTIRQTVDGVEHERRLVAGDVHVLAPTGAALRVIAEALYRARIPYAFYRQDGLFATHEAHALRGLIDAIAHEGDESRRLIALETPFFGIPLAELPSARKLSQSDPRLVLLTRWQRLASDRRIDAVLDECLSATRLFPRLLLAGDGERPMTNYAHLIELLHGELRSGSPDIQELARRFSRWVDRTEDPEGEGDDIQRIAADSDAVQLLTMHKSKGLEAPIIFLYAGFSNGRAQGKLRRVRLGQTPLLHVSVKSKTKSAPFDALMAQQTAEEHQRLLYVALTRAKVRLYLPRMDEPKGPYFPLGERLAAMDQSLPSAHSREPREDSTRFGAIAVDEPAPPSRDPTQASLQALGRWSPPPGSLVVVDDGASLRAARSASAPLIVTSYSALKRARDAGDRPDAQRDDARDDEPTSPAVAPRVDEALPPGAKTGSYLHEILERIELAGLLAEPTFEAWSVRVDVLELAERIRLRHGMPARATAAALTLAHRVLAEPIAIDASPEVAAVRLFQCPGRRELAFTFPLPAKSHPALGNALPAPSDQPPFRVERGFVVGSVDMVFTAHDRTYFADWKSDSLPSYARSAISAHVAEHYTLQAQLYSLAVVRLLGIRDERAYEARFGGLLYAFLRGMDDRSAPSQAIFLQRPTWSEVVAWETALRESSTIERLVQLAAEGPR